MKDGRIPKDILYGKFTAEKHNLGRPQLRYRDVCKRDMKKVSIDKNKQEEQVAELTVPTGEVICKPP